MKTLLYIILFIIVVGFVGLYFYDQSTKRTNLTKEQINMGIEGLDVQDIIVGTGDLATKGKKITVNYVGTLKDTGVKFDSSYDRGEAFPFILGAGEVIKGWDEGFNGMKVGGKRKLVISPELGYGASDMGVIPPYSTLVFEVELLSVE